MPSPDANPGAFAFVREDAYVDVEWRTCLSPAVIADALFAAETERAFADTRHSLDFINKAFECLDLIGWEHAATLELRHGCTTRRRPT
jgi:hypothetical protein